MIRPLRRVRPGVWRSRDDRYEFVGGRSIDRGSGDVWWDSYEVVDGVVANEPVFGARSATLADVVAEIEALDRG